MKVAQAVDYDKETPINIEHTTHDPSIAADGESNIIDTMTRRALPPMWDITGALLR